MTPGTLKAAAEHSGIVPCTAKFFYRAYNDANYGRPGPSIWQWILLNVYNVNLIVPFST